MKALLQIVINISWLYESDDAISAGASEVNDYIFKIFRWI